MTRILRIIASSNPRAGGPIEGTRRFAEVWAHDGHRQDLLTLDAPGESFLTDYPGEISRVGPPRSRNPLSKYRFAPDLVRWLRVNARNYDAILVSGLWQYQTLGARQALAKGPTPYFVFPHGMLDPWFRTTYPAKHLVKQALWWVAEGPLLAHARAVLFTSEEERLRAQGVFRPYKMNGVVVNYGTLPAVGDPQKQGAAFRATVPELGNRPYLLFLSRIHPKKGCDLLVEAFAGVAGAPPELNLVIAGPDQAGLVNTLRGQAERLGIGGKVHFPGMLTGDAKAGALRDAEAFVLPSHQENFGIVVAEALAAGTPVLISDQVYIWREIVADGAGLVEPDSIEGTRALLERFLALAPTERTILRERAKVSFERRFNVEHAARSLMTLIQESIGK